MTPTADGSTKRFPSGLAGGERQLAASETGCVLFPLEPLPDESIAGFILRTARWNYLDCASLLRSINAVHSSMSIWACVASAPAEAASRLGTSLQEIKLRAYAPSAPGEKHMIDYFGTPLERYRLNLHTRRISPESLRVSVHHRANWEIAALNFCPESWEFLIDQCPRCRGKLTWRTSELNVCGACGSDLTHVGVTKVDPCDREMLALAASLVHPLEARRRSARATLPETFQTFSETAIFDLALIFSRTLRRHSPDPWLRSDLRPSSRLAKAMELVFDFPHSFERTVASSHHDNVRQSELLLQWGDELASSRYPELRRFGQTVTIMRGPRRLRAMREARGMLTLRETASRLQIQRSAVTRLVRLGAFGSSTQRGAVRVLKWFDPQIVELIGDRLRDRISAREIERTFGLPRTAIEQLVSLRLLHVTDDPAVRELYGGLQFRRHSFNFVIDCVRAALVEPEPDVPRITLADLFQGVGGREKPWGAIIDALLTDQLPGGLALAPAARLRFCDLIVQRQFAEDFLAGAYPHLMVAPPPAPGLALRDFVTRLEAERYLNCFPRDLCWLIENGHLANAGDRPLRISREEIQRLGSELISSREILRRWRISPTFRDSLSSRYGIERALGPFWPRSAVSDLLSGIFPHGRPT
jgi:predicted DNA-binding transcriptional regulator AlpA